MESFKTFSQSVYYQLLDVLIIFISILVSYKAYRFLNIGQNVFYDKTNILPLGLLFSIFCVLILFMTGVYEKESGVLNSQEIKNTIKGITISFLMLTLFFYFGKYQFSRYVIFFSYITATTLLVAEKILIYNYAPFKFFFQKKQKRILIYGAGQIGTSLFRYITDSPRLNINPIGFIDDNPAKIGTWIKSCGFSKKIIRIPVLGPMADIEALARQYDVHEIYIAISDISNEQLVKTIALLKHNNFKVSFVPNLYKLVVHKVKLDKIGQLPIISECYDEHIPLQFYMKTFFDVTVSLALLILLLPLFMIISILIKMDSKGPVFFKQNRVGKDKRLFEIYKFRSLYPDADPYSINPTHKSDKRITRIGGFLRKTSLDELPQLINVLKGDMSLVGPRPEMEFIVKEYDEIQQERLRVKPGITGLWQLSGDREVAIHQNMEYDLFYVKKWSFFLDIAILLKTVVFAFKGL